jgi:hypothetical protein
MPMQLGEYPLPYYPSAFTSPCPDRSNAFVLTAESVAHFSWGFFIVGKTIDVQWDYMPSEQFEALEAIFQEDKEVFWDPGIPGLSLTYNVQIVDFTGDFHEAVGTATEIWRKNCKMTLLIMSENAESS